MKDSHYMLRALRLAAKGRGAVSPNPMVGAVIVYDDRIIGEGYHRQYGEAHAEVNAVESVADKRLLQRSVMYVTLEPCSHWGKTPPCAELIIRMRIPRVVIACVDPFPQVSGRGIALLREAGVRVDTGVCQHEARELNRSFITAFEKCRPYITLKWAQSADGFLDKPRLADAPHIPTPISSAYTRLLVHKLRSEVDAILVGTNTAILDNPSLTVRYWAGKNPTRVVIDRSHRIPADAQLFNGIAQTLLFTERMRADVHAESICIDFDNDPLFQIIRALHNRKMYHLLVEGGARIHQSFLTAGLCDELLIETSAVSFGGGVKAPAPQGRLVSCQQYGSNQCSEYRL